MTDFATIYDAVVTRLGTLLPGHRRLIDAYELDVNPGSHLEKGWGLAIAGGDNTQRFLSSTRSVAIALQVKITRRIYSVGGDALGAAAVDKLLIADFQTILDDAHQGNFGVRATVATGFGGVENIGFEKPDLFRAITINVNVEYIRQ